MSSGSFSFELPDWVSEAVAARPSDMSDVEERMRFVLGLASRHVASGTGGPFAAAVFDALSHELIAVGVNLVVPSSSPVAHAEVVAFSFAGQQRGNFDLGAGGPTELVTSTEPCAMCLGAVHWSGISRLVIAARDEDARASGFDEGNKPEGWEQAFAGNGIEVVRDVLRSHGADVLRTYAEGGGEIYNAGGTGLDA